MRNSSSGKAPKGWSMRLLSTLLGSTIGGCQGTEHAAGLNKPKAWEIAGFGAQTALADWHQSVAAPTAFNLPPCQRDTSLVHMNFFTHDSQYTPSNVTISSIVNPDMAFLHDPSSKSPLSIPVGIIIGLLASFVQSLGLTIQRKSHVIDQSLPEQHRSVEHRRPYVSLSHLADSCTRPHAVAQQKHEFALTHSIRILGYGFSDLPYSSPPTSSALSFKSHRFQSSSLLLLERYHSYGTPSLPVSYWAIDSPLG